jgi:hypothetical protein
LCSWDLLCCSSHTENQHNPKIWGWSMKRNHLGPIGNSSWFHRRYDAVPTPFWSILLPISSSDCKKQQKSNICWWLVDLVDPLSLVQSCSNQTNMAMENPENPPFARSSWNLHVFRGIPASHVWFLQGWSC